VITERSSLIACAVDSTNIDLSLILVIKLFPCWSKTFAVPTPRSKEFDKPWLLRRDTISSFVYNKLIEIFFDKYNWFHRWLSYGGSGILRGLL
jgi:hypothetical protein